MELPRHEWEQSLSHAPSAVAALLSFMSDDHSLVRNFVVREIPNAGQPLSPKFIAQELKLSLERVNEILDDLEKNLVFLFRNNSGDVSWAYPVTCETTPHHFTFESGEQTYAA
ncbi:MAG: hypothetical protein GY839_02770 [candidate division Zixibacteria bacterium]|nr:hypothetical protein [candidate division Zixibacteria bacterium]